MVKKETLISQFFLKINGSPAPRELMDALIEIIVEDNLHLPDMFSIQLHDSRLKWAESALLQIGNEVEISAQGHDPRSKRAGPARVLMQGEITGLEPALLGSGVPTLVVRGYDHSYRLHQGRQIRSFLQITDSELAQRIADEVGLKAEVQPTSNIHPHVIQNHQTNMEFLQERAWRLGYHLYVESGTLYFGPEPSNGGGPPPRLKWGIELISFQPSLTTIQQVDEVVVRGWDPITKQAVVGRATHSDLAPRVKGRDRAERRFKGTNQVVVSCPVQTQAEAEALARSWRDEIGGDLIRAEGVCLGNPQVKAGQAVNIKGVGSQFNGQYFVTLAIHTYSAEAGYKTAFSVGGRRAETITSLLTSRQANRSPTQGVVVGLVTNNQDPEGLGRIKVKYPGLDGLEESPWLRLATPMAGESRGFYCLPEINDEVLVAFEQGDIHRPYMLGMLWNGPDRPPEANRAVLGSDGRVNRRLIRSRSGHQITLDDTGGQEQLIISDQSGNRIVMANGLMTIQAQGDLTIEAGGKLKIEAGGNVNLKGKDIEVTV